VKRFRGGLVFKAHRLLYHSTLGLRVIKKKKVSQLRSRSQASVKAEDGSSIGSLLSYLRLLTGPTFSWRKDCPVELFLSRSQVSVKAEEAQEGRCKATWKREFKLPWREAGPPNHHDDKVDRRRSMNSALVGRPRSKLTRRSGTLHPVPFTLHPVP